MATRMTLSNIGRSRLRIRRNFTTQGRAGTSFRPLGEYVEERGIHPACLIYFSDMECGDYGPESAYPVMSHRVDAHSVPG